MHVSCNARESSTNVKSLLVDHSQHAAVVVTFEQPVEAKREDVMQELKKRSVGELSSKKKKLIQDVINQKENIIRMMLLQTRCYELIAISSTWRILNRRQRLW